MQFFDISKVADEIRHLASEADDIWYKCRPPAENTWFELDQPGIAALAFQIAYDNIDMLTVCGVSEGLGEDGRYGSYQISNRTFIEGPPPENRGYVYDESIVRFGLATCRFINTLPILQRVTKPARSGLRKAVRAAGVAGEVTYTVCVIGKPSAPRSPREEEGDCMPLHFVRGHYKPKLSKRVGREIFINGDYRGNAAYGIKLKSRYIVDPRK